MSRGRWGRAGVRLTNREARAADMRSGRRRLEEQQALDAAHRRWAAGELVPARITIALDLHELYGPEVDAACGVAEPDVDRWEAGELYPTWEQLLALSEITPMVALSFFFLGMSEEDPAAPRSTLRFHMPVEELDREPVVKFTPEAFTAPPHADATDVVVSPQSPRSIPVHVVDYARFYLLHSPVLVNHPL